MKKVTRNQFLGSALGALALPLGISTKGATGIEAPGFNGLGAGLGTLPLLTRADTRSVCPENPTGEKGKGGMAVPNPADPDLPFSKAASDLGQGWKVRPFVKPRSGETITIMDVDGPGIIEHIWMATEENWAGNGRACILRFYWDDEVTPSIEVPMTDFFAVGHDIFARVNSLAVVVNPTSALNCYWPMPFRKHARVTFTNESDKALSLMTYQITYTLAEIPPHAGFLHAQWRRAVTDRSFPMHTLLEGIKGQGRYVGTFLAWAQLSDGWFGEGEMKFFIDGDTQFPTINGTGTEDYFGGSYGFPEIYSTPYSGCTLRHANENGPTKWSLYRWHLMDPINFNHDLRVDIQALGWWPNGKYQPLADDISSVAYWYQSEPHAEFPKLPPLAERWPR
jgi:D-arabinan exo alpha-(1,3)/(1,5)-arabinofuranosidase (non-reducing end)